MLQYTAKCQFVSIAAIGPRIRERHPRSTKETWSQTKCKWLVPGLWPASS